MPGLQPGLTEHGDGITAIDTDLLRPQFDACHLIVENGRAAFVDSGVNSSVPLFLATLEQKNVDPTEVDYLFLTHVHLDHAGGAGLLMQSLPPLPPELIILLLMLSLLDIFLHSCII